MKTPRPNPYAELTNRDSDIVQAALTRRCEICKAKPTQDCINTIDSRTLLLGRLVHFTRTCK